MIILFLKIIIKNILLNRVDIMDEIDKKAIEILLNAPFMTEEEMKNTIKILKQMARMKKNRGSIREILDYWANQAYILSMEA